MTAISKGNSGGASWKVAGQVETMSLDGTGRYVQGVTVTFTTGDGHTGSVFLPSVGYTLDKVRAAVQARADLLDAVGNLEG